MSGDGRQAVSAASLKGQRASTHAIEELTVAIVLGANDVCNPAANNDPTSPIAGMPVLNVWDSQTVFVIKRSLSAGYAGIRNELFELDNSLMCFGDAKKFLEELIVELKDQ